MLVGCAGPELAETFGKRLKLKHCMISYVQQADMPRWGQLGCQGFIILDSSGSVACETTPAFMEVEGLAFKYVEMALSALLSKKSIPEVGPGTIVHIKDSLQTPGLAGLPAMCISPENSDGKCEVALRYGKTLWIHRTSLISKEEEISGDCDRGCKGNERAASECCKKKKSCDNDRSTACAGDCAATSKESFAAALEASADKVNQACLAVGVGIDQPADALHALQLEMVVAKTEFKAMLADAKQILEGDARLTKFSINGPCTNGLCLCAVCECGITCRCNIADVKDTDTCEKCVDFRAKKKAAAEAVGPRS